MSRFGATLVTRQQPSRFGASRVSPPAEQPAEPQTLRQFVGEETARTLTPETAIEGGHVDDFVSFLKGKADKLGEGSDERANLLKSISGLQKDVAEFRSQQHEAKRLGVSRETAARLNSPIGAAEASLAKSAIGQTALRAEQGLSSVAEAGLSLASKAVGSGQLSATLHRDKALREEFLTAAEQGGQIESMLGESGSRVYGGVVSSLTKMGATGLAGPAALYSAIAGETYDDALHEAQQSGMSGGKAVVYAGTKAAVETGLTLLMGKIGQKLGAHTTEEILSPGLKQAAKKLVESAGLKGRVTAFTKGTALESGEELLIDAVHQGVELQAGTSKGFDWKRLLEAGAAGAASRGAVGPLQSALRKMPQHKIEETVKGVKSAEIAAGVRPTPSEGPGLGIQLAKRFFNNATPEMMEAAGKHLNAAQFAELTGIKKSSQTFRDAFRSTMELYAQVPKLAGSEQNTTTGQIGAPDAAPIASETGGAAPESSLQPPSETAAPGPEPESAPELTSPKQEFVQADREMLGLPPVPSAETQGWESDLTTARDNGVPNRALDIARNLLAEPRALSPVESAGLSLKGVELKNAHDAAEQRLKDSTDPTEQRFIAAELDRTTQDLDDLTTALYMSGSERGRALASQKLALKRDYSIAAIAGRAQAAKGERITTPQRQSLESLADQLADVEVKIIGHTGDADQLTALELQRDKLKRKIRQRIQSFKPQSLWDHTKAPLNASRTLIASSDLSAVMRQGGFITFGRPLLAAKAFGPMIRAARSEVAAKQINDEIAARPNAPMYKAAKLYLHDDNADTAQREESFASEFVSRLPFIAGSQRAYTTFLNKMRADTFDTLIATLAKNGEPTLKEAQAIANYVNVATGRGGLGKFDRALTESSALFFAPRYVVSRFQLLTGDPIRKAPPEVKRLIANEYGRYLIGVSLFYAMAGLTFGEEDGFSITFDPRSSDFGKINFNGTRLDPLSGLAQATTFLGRMISGQTKNVAGEISSIRGDDAGMGRTAADVASRFVRTKLAPVPGMAMDVLSGKNVVGEPVTAGSLAAGAAIPLSFRDITEAITEQGVPRGTALSIAGLMGMGLQTYEAQ